MVTLRLTQTSNYMHTISLQEYVTTTDIHDAAWDFQCNFRPSNAMQWHYVLFAVVAFPYAMSRRTHLGDPPTHDDTDLRWILNDKWRNFSCSSSSSSSYQNQSSNDLFSWYISRVKYKLVSNILCELQIFHRHKLWMMRKKRLNSTASICDRYCQLVCQCATYFL